MNTLYGIYLLTLLHVDTILNKSPENIEPWTTLRMHDRDTLYVMFCQKLYKFNSLYFFPRIIINPNPSNMRISDIHIIYWSAKQQLPILKTLKEIIHTRVTLCAILCEKIPLWRPHTSHYHHFNNRIFPIENPVKNGHDHLALLIIFSLTITVL